MKRLLKICVIAVMLMFGIVAPKASATTFASVFLNPPQDGRGCGISDFSWSQQEADNFQLTGPYLTLTQVRWWGAYGSTPDPAPTDNFNVRFFSDSGGQPSINPFAQISLLDLTRTATGMTASAWGGHDGGTVYEYIGNLSSPLTVNAATTYYLSVVNDTGSTWGWLEDGTPSHWYRGSDGTSWSYSERDTNLSFELLAVPEPTTICLLALGGFFLLRKR